MGASQVFFVVLARDASGVDSKIRELSQLGYPYVIVCGEHVDHPNCVHRPARGKYDAMNFGMNFVTSDTDVVVFNDVDTEVHHFKAALNLLNDTGISLVVAKVNVKQGPQLAFYSFLDRIRRRIPIAASGELMLIRYPLIRSLIPLKGCKAEDSYILFKVLEKGGKAKFCEGCYVTTDRTSAAKQEESYKRRTVGGIYQALALSHPPAIVRLFYMFLPFISPFLLMSGKKGYYWSKGILLGYVDYVRGDRATSWQKTCP